MTAAKSVIKMSQKDFNSHAHVERDNGLFALYIMSLHFNSHAHVERDSKGVYQNEYKHYFNSHAHVERDIC